MDKTRRILIVEGDEAFPPPSLRGYVFEVAPSPVDALRTLVADPPDAVIVTGTVWPDEIGDAFQPALRRHYDGPFFVLAVDALGAMVLTKEDFYAIAIPLGYESYDLSVQVRDRSLAWKETLAFLERIWKVPASPAARTPITRPRVLVVEGDEGFGTLAHRDIAFVTAPTPEDALIAVVESPPNAVVVAGAVWPTDAWGDTFPIALRHRYTGLVVSLGNSAIRGEPFVAPFDPDPHPRETHTRYSAFAGSADDLYRVLDRCFGRPSEN